MKDDLDIRFDLATEQKVKDFFQNARKYLTNKNLEQVDEKTLINIFGNTTNAVYNCFTNFIDSDHFEDWLDIAELILENTPIHYLICI